MYRLTVTRAEASNDPEVLEDVRTARNETFYTLHDAWQAALSAMPCDAYAKGYIAGLQQHGGCTGTVFADQACTYAATVTEVSA